MGKMGEVSTTSQMAVVEYRTWWNANPTRTSTAQLTESGLAFAHL